MGRPKPSHIKQNRRQLQKKLVLKAKKIRDEARFPYLGRFYGKEEFLKGFGSHRKHPRTLLLDLDSTLIRLFPGKRSHRPPEFRLYFNEFIAAAGDFANLFVFSATNPVRLGKIAEKYLGERLLGFLNHRFCPTGKKNRLVGPDRSGGAQSRRNALAHFQVVPEVLGLRPHLEGRQKRHRTTRTARETPPKVEDPGINKHFLMILESLVKRILVRSPSLLYRFDQRGD